MITIPPNKAPQRFCNLKASSTFLTFSICVASTTFEQDGHFRATGILPLVAIISAARMLSGFEFSKVIEILVAGLEECFVGWRSAVSSVVEEGDEIPGFPIL